MMANNQEQQLFDSLRESPTELNLEKVESMIMECASWPAQPEAKNNWNDLFNLKKMIMYKNIIGLLIPATIAIGFIAFFNTDKIAKTAIVDSETKPKIEEAANTEILAKAAETLNATEVVQTPEVSKTMEEPPLEIKEPSPIKPQISTSTKPKENQDPSLNVSSQEENKAMKNNVQKQLNEPSVVIIPKEEEAYLTKEIVSTPKRSDRNTASVLQPEIVSPTTYPDLSSGELRRMKRKLMKALKKDGLIDKETMEIELYLPGDRIEVNNQRLSPSLFQKYMQLTKKAGYGPERKIKLNEEFIKVGDFTPKGFIGSGYGTFQETFVEQEGGLFDKAKKEKRAKEERNRMEQKELFAFSENLLAASSRKTAKGKRSGVNLKNKKIQKLFYELYTELLKDALIDSKKDFVLIELPKDEIWVNGKTLDASLMQKYENLFSSYKIRHSGRRQIRLSEHIIQVGDFKVGSFSGTSCFFD